LATITPSTMSARTSGRARPRTLTATTGPPGSRHHQARRPSRRSEPPGDVGKPNRRRTLHQ
jgi:hypothetical protein